MLNEQKVNELIKESMKSGDKGRLRALRALKAAILLFNTDGSGNKAKEKDIIGLVQKLVKQRKDSLSIYKEQGRDDLAVIESEEITALESLLPKQLSDEELKNALTKIKADNGFEGMKDMGPFMGIARTQLSGQADGSRIAQAVKALLQS